MKNINQRVLPAISKMKDYESFLKSPYPFCVIMDFHIGQLGAISAMAQKFRKNLIIHVDLIKGLSSNEYGAIYLCQNIKVDGLISTHSSVIQVAKKKEKIAIQRIFLIDRQALAKSYRLIENSKPDYIEMLPGLMPKIVTEMKERISQPIIAGGLITTEDEIHNVLEAGAVAVTTSNRALWTLNESFN